MKLVPALLAFSVVANVALLAFLTLKPSQETLLPNKESAAQSPVSNQAPLTKAASDEQKLMEALRSGDINKLKEVIDGMGLSKADRDNLIRGVILAKYLDQLRRLEFSNNADLPYWKRVSDRDAYSPKRNAERRKMMSSLDKDLRDAGVEMDELFGGGNRYTYLSPEKQAQLRLIERDYQDMMSDIQVASSGFPLKSDQEKRKLLQDERKKEIDALLTPEERQAMALRADPSTNKVRYEYGTVLQSEEEFKRVYELQKAFDAKYGNNDQTMLNMGSNQGPRANPKFAEDQKLLQEQIDAMLGPERVAALAREKDPDVRTLEAATQRLNLAANTTDQVLTVRQQLAERSAQISKDESLSPAQKTAALKELGAGARRMLEPVLGQDGTEAFAQRSQWISALNRGSSFTVNPRGGVQVTQRANPTPRPQPLPAPSE